MTYGAILTAAKTRYLAIVGGFHPSGNDAAPEGCQTLLMLGPDEPEFWPAFVQSPEYKDGADHAMDRWSHRVLGDLAEAHDGRALFPSDGPPYAPFYDWALKAGRCRASPVRLLVHDKAGLFVSFRGVIALSERITLPVVTGSPCETCVGQPCLSACPVQALNSDGYDVPACKSFLSVPQGKTCLEGGCIVRRSCPVSDQYGRLAEQSAFHMRAFLKP